MFYCYLKLYTSKKHPLYTFILTYSKYIRRHPPISSKSFLNSIYVRIWYIHLCRDKHIISEWVDSINIPFPYATLTHSYLVIVAFRFCIFLLNVALIFNIALLSTAYIPYANISPAFRFSFLFLNFLSFLSRQFTTLKCLLIIPSIYL